LCLFLVFLSLYIHSCYRSSLSRSFCSQSFYLGSLFSSHLSLLAAWLLLVTDYTYTLCVFMFSRLTLSLWYPSFIHSYSICYRQSFFFSFFVKKTVLVFNIHIHVIFILTLLLYAYSCILYYYIRTYSSGCFAAWIPICTYLYIV